MSIPLKPHQSLQSLAAQRVSGFEELVGTKYQENKKWALHQKLYLIFSEHTLFTLVRENVN
ncbi:hypothetical protein FP515_01040 [Geobacillus thermoleovorans]|nr:hypothetical protein FP515_01040 [Geobacillus thermoleovorans]